MATVTDRVDRGRQLHEGAGLHEGEHPSGHDRGGSNAHHWRYCPPTLVRRWDILQGHRRPVGSGVSGSAAAGCGARSPCAALAPRDAADRAAGDRRDGDDTYLSKGCGRVSAGGSMLTVKIRQPSHEFTFGVGMTFVSYSLVLTPVV
jgi:hypothetical protein